MTHSNLKTYSLSMRDKKLGEAANIFEKKVLSHFNKLDAACDIGTGNGNTTFALARHFKSVFAIDIDELSLKKAEEKAREQKLTNIKFKLADAHHLPCLDSEFDVCCCRAAIHHFDDADSVLKEVHRILRPDGFFCLMDFCFSDYTSQILKPLSIIREDDFKRYYSFHGYCDLFEAGGFNIDCIYTYTLQRNVSEWISIAPKEIHERLNRAFLNIDNRVLKELKVQEEADGQKTMIYRIVEIVGKKKKQIIM